MTAYVINLARRPDRWTTAQRLWSPYFDLVHFPATEIAGDGARGCKLSHEACAEKYLRGNEMIVVLEDDAEPTNEFESNGQIYIEQARQHIGKWELINCGPYLDLTSLGMPKADLSSTESKVFLRAGYMHQTHFMIYNRCSLTLLQASLTSPLHIDMYLGKHASELWVPIKLLATQADGQSDVQSKEFDKKALYQATENMLSSYGN